MEHIREKMGKVMMERWGVPLLGVVPDLPYLGTSSLRDIEKAYRARARSAHPDKVGATKPQTFFVVLVR